MPYPTDHDEDALAEHAEWTVQHTDPAQLFACFDRDARLHGDRDALIDLEFTVLREARAEGWYDASEGDWLAWLIAAEVRGQIERRLRAAVQQLGC